MQQQQQRQEVSGHERQMESSGNQQQHFNGMDGNQQQPPNLSPSMMGMGAPGAAPIDPAVMALFQNRSVCRHFLQGKCHWAACRFSHPELPPGFIPGQVSPQAGGTSPQTPSFPPAPMASPANFSFRNGANGSGGNMQQQGGGMGMNGNNNNGMGYMSPLLASALMSLANQQPLPGNMTPPPSLGPSAQQQNYNGMGMNYGSGMMGSGNGSGMSSVPGSANNLMGGSNNNNGQQQNYNGMMSPPQLNAPNPTPVRVGGGNPHTPSSSFNGQGVSPTSMMNINFTSSPMRNGGGQLTPQQQSLVAGHMTPPQGSLMGNGSFGLPPATGPTGSPMPVPLSPFPGPRTSNQCSPSPTGNSLNNERFTHDPYSMTESRRPATPQSGAMSQKQNSTGLYS